MRGIALSNHGITRVLGEVPLRNVELRLWSAINGAVRAKSGRRHQGAHIRARCFRRNPPGRNAQHIFANAQLNRRSGPPSHGDRGGAPQIHDFGKVQMETEIFGGHGRNEKPGLVKKRAGQDQPIHLRTGQSRVGKRQPAEIGNLFQMQRLGRAAELLRFVFGDPSDRRKALQSHPAPQTSCCHTLRYRNMVYVTVRSSSSFWLRSALIQLKKWPSPSLVCFSGPQPSMYCSARSSSPIRNGR